jgi:tetratricopeptide (TPR) repeat protein
LQLESLVICREVGDREGEAVNLDTLGLIEQMEGRHEEAIARCTEALVIAREIGYRRGEGYVLTHIGYSHLERGELAAARSAFNEAVAVRFALGDSTPTVVDNLAALARVALAEGNPRQASAFATEALERMGASGADGVEYPIRAYRDCYRALCGIDGPDEAARARRALEDGRALLDRRAANIQDPSLRAAFLGKVPFNRELLALAESGAS